MAKAIIEFQDNNSGNVDIKINFEPELSKEQALTMAQKMALAFAGKAGLLIEDVFDGD